MATKPNRRQRLSLANAIQLLREAGFRSEANKLSNYLQDTVSDGFLCVEKLKRGVGNTDLATNTITVDPSLFGRKVLDRCNPKLIELAGTLLHECLHVGCFDELAAYGNELALYRMLLSRLDDLYAECSRDKRRKLARELRKQIRLAKLARRKIVIGGGPGYGFDEFSLEETKDLLDFLFGEDDDKKAPIPPKPPLGPFRIPAEPRSAGGAHLYFVGTAISAYFAKTGSYPPGPNATMVEALDAVGLCPFGAADLNKGGEVVDPWGQPYVYLAPGEIFEDDFDLYSLGEHGKDDGGDGRNLLYFPRMR